MVKFAELDKPFEVHTGASDFTIGGWLMQGEWALHVRALSLMVSDLVRLVQEMAIPRVG